MTAPRPTSRQRTKADRSAGRRAAAGRGMPNLAGPQRTAANRTRPTNRPPDRSGPTEADQDRERSQNTGMFGKRWRNCACAGHSDRFRPAEIQPGRFPDRMPRRTAPAVCRCGRSDTGTEGGGRRRKGCVADGEALNRNRADAQGRDPYRTGDLSECSRHSRTFHTDGRRRRFRCAETSCSPSSWSGFCIREDRGTSHAVHSRPRLRHAVPERTGRRATSTPRAAAGRFARRTSDPDRKRISDCEPEIYAGADRLVCGTRNRTKRPIKKRDTATIRKTNDRHFGNTTIR